MDWEYRNRKLSFEKVTEIKDRFFKEKMTLNALGRA